MPMEAVMFPYIIFGKMSFNTKIEIITGSNIAVAPSYRYAKYLDILIMLNGFA